MAFGSSIEVKTFPEFKVSGAFGACVFLGFKNQHEKMIAYFVCNSYIILVFTKLQFYRKSGKSNFVLFYCVLLD